MPTGNESPFDEQEALQALEHLRGQIQDARARREQKVAEFDAFLRSSRAASHAERLAALGEAGLEGPPAPDSPHAPSTPPASASPPAPAVQTAARSADRAREVTAPVTAPPRLEPVHASYRPEPRPDPFGERVDEESDHRWILTAASAVVVVALFVYLQAWRSGEPAASGPSPSTGGASAAEGPAPQASGAASGTPAPAAPASPRALQVDLTATRDVWMRVLADGKVVFEGTIRGGQTRGVGADRAVAIRAGDAGALRLRVGGQDRGALGRDGQVVNRTLTR
jgi:hypothetical protein